MKMKTYLDNLFFVFLASIVIGPGLVYYKLYAFHIVLVMLIISLVVAHLKKQQHNFIFTINGDAIFWLVFTAWYALGLIWTYYLIGTLKYVVFLIFGFLIIFFITSFSTSEKNFKRAFKAIAITFIIGLIFSFLESFTSFRWPSYPLILYWNLYLPANVDISFMEIYKNISEQSWSSSFWGQKNSGAVAISLLLPFFLMSKNNIFRFLGTSAVLIVIIMSTSRGALIACSVGLLTYFVATKKIKSLFYFLATIICLTFIVFQNQDYFKKIGVPVDRYSAMASAISSYGHISEKYVDGSVSIRKQLIINGLNAFIASKGLGVGGYASIKVQADSGITNGLHKKTYLHNFWIEILVEAGILGFTMFLGWYLYTMFRLAKIYKNTTSEFFKYHAGSLFLAMLIFSIACISLGTAMYFLTMWILFGLSTAICHLDKITNIKHLSKT